MRSVSCLGDVPGYWRSPRLRRTAAQATMSALSTGESGIWPVQYRRAQSRRRGDRDLLAERGELTEETGFVFETAQVEENPAALDAPDDRHRQSPQKPR